jgi:signal transduction histidine kinase
MLLAVIAGYQYRWLSALAQAEQTHVERGWDDATTMASSALNRRLTALYSAVVVAFQNNDGFDRQALSQLIEDWRHAGEFGKLLGAVYARRATDGSWLQAGSAEREPPFKSTSFESLSVLPRTPLAATWLPWRDSGGLPAMAIALEAPSQFTLVLFTMSSEGCRQLLPLMASRYFPQPAEDVRLGIVHVSASPQTVCADNGFDPRRKPEAAADVFRLTVPGTLPQGQRGFGAGVGIVAATDGPREQWELRSQHRGDSLAETVQRANQRNAWFLTGTELLLVAAIAVIAQGARRARLAAAAHVRFAAAMAHEVRTPLAAIKVLAQNQARGLVRTEKQRTEYGEAIADEADRLHAFVERVLQFSSGHASTGSVRRAPMDLDRIVKAAVTPLDPQTNANGISVTVRVPAENGAEYFGDEAAITLALRNLVQNVLDHSEGARTIEVSARIENEDLVFSVKDDGAGVPPSDRKMLFEPFARGLRAQERRVPGHGLGLAIVRDVASAHDGAVWYEAPSSGGAVFAFRIRNAVETDAA